MSRFSVSDSEIFTTQVRPFDCIERLTVDFGKALQLLKEIEVHTGVKDVYRSELPFIYVEGQYRKMRYFDFDLDLEFPNETTYDEMTLIEIFKGLLDSIVDEYFDENENRANLILSINKLYIDNKNNKYIANFSVDVAKVDNQPNDSE